MSFTPTHTYDDVPVQRVGTNYQREDGTYVSSKLFNRTLLVVLEAQPIDLTPGELGLVLQAANPSPGKGVMPGYATDVRGNNAKLVSTNVIHLYLNRRDGGVHYQVDLPEVFKVVATKLEG